MLRLLRPEVLYESGTPCRQKRFPATDESARRLTFAETRPRSGDHFPKERVAHASQFGIRPASSIGFDAARFESPPTFVQSIALAAGNLRTAEAASATERT